jgi:hypothetical protein
MKKAIPFHLIVRLGKNDPNPNGIVPHSDDEGAGTHVTEPLTSAVLRTGGKIHRIITDDPESGPGEQ